MSSRGMVLSLKNDFILVIARSAISSKLSSVAPAQCGEITVFSATLEGTHYRVVLLKKYRDLPKIIALPLAPTIAVSSMRPPLAQFMIIAPFLYVLLLFCLLDSSYWHLAGSEV